MRRGLLCGNWKMNLDRAAAIALASAVRDGVDASQEPDDVAVVLFPPFPYLECVSDVLQGSSVRLGAQTLHEAERGAYTGEVSAGMLRDVGCEMVLVGHSERRHGLGEDDATVARKALAALTAGLTPIVCVGETGQERNAGETNTVLERQVAALVRLLGEAELATGCALAYEPVWAIGTGRVATPMEAQAAHAHIRGLLGNPGEFATLLYGGSLKGDNAHSLFANPDVDGGLVGGASLEAEDFLRMLPALRETVHLNQLKGD